MAFNKTFIRTVTKLTDGVNDFDEIQQNKIFTDLGAIQTDINNIETETDSLDSSVSTANINNNTILNNLDWEGEYYPYNIAGTATNTEWRSYINITGNGWFSGFFVNGISSALWIAVTIDGVVKKSTGSPLILINDADRNEIIVPFLIHFNSSLYIQVRNATDSRSGMSGLYWI